MIQDLSTSWCIKGTGESITRVDSPVSLMHHDLDRSWITDPDPDHSKGTQPLSVPYKNPLRKYRRDARLSTPSSRFYTLRYCCLRITSLKDLVQILWNTTLPRNSIIWGTLILIFHVFAPGIMESILCDILGPIFGAN